MMCAPLTLLLCVILGLLLDGAQFADGRRLVAVGDLHGDLNQTLAALRLGRIIDNQQRWSGGDTIFVQVGDVLDVGPDDIRVVELFMRLEKSARAHGGEVVQLLGNHELRNFRGDFSAVDPGSLMYSGGDEGRRVLLSNKTKLGMYLRTRRAIFHHGPYLFMHGGFSTATASMITNINKVERFNEHLRIALVTGSVSDLAAEGLNLNEDDVDAVSNPILVRSILHVRCDDLTRVLDKKFPGIASVIVGHVPHDAEDFEDWRLCGGRLIDIDFGLSRWKKGDPGHVAVLEIDDTNGHIQLLETTMKYPEWETVAPASGTTNWQPVLKRLAVFFVVGVVALLVARFVVKGVCWKPKVPAPGDAGQPSPYGTMV